MSITSSKSIIRIQCAELNKRTLPTPPPPQKKKNPAEPGQVTNTRQSYDSYITTCHHRENIECFEFTPRSHVTPQRKSTVCRTITRRTNNRGEPNITKQLSTAETKPPSVSLSRDVDTAIPSSLQRNPAMPRVTDQENNHNEDKEIRTAPNKSIPQGKVHSNQEEYRNAPSCISREVFSG